jgi:hypothetical protein
VDSLSTLALELGAGAKEAGIKHIALRGVEGELCLSTNARDNCVCTSKEVSLKEKNPSHTFEEKCV